MYRPKPSWVDPLLEAFAKNSGSLSEQRKVLLNGFLSCSISEGSLNDSMKLAKALRRNLTLVEFKIIISVCISLDNNHDAVDAYNEMVELYDCET